MFITVLLALGAFVCVYPKTRSHLDLALYTAAKKILSLLKPPSQQPDDLTFVAMLINQIKAGNSIERALENIAISSQNASINLKCKHILNKQPQNDIVSQMVSSAVKSGSPILEQLTVIKNSIQSSHNLKLKAAAQSSQSRAQANVLSFLPWLLVFLLFIFDMEGGLSCIKDPMLWYLWATASLFIFLGRTWLKKIVEKSLNFSGTNDKIEYIYAPEVALRCYSLICSGIDAETALEKALLAVGAPAFTKAILDKDIQLNNTSCLQDLIACSSQGASIKADLIKFYQNCQSELALKIETQIQTLPVKCLLPLFICFFPSIFMVVLSLILPTIIEVL